MPIPVVRPWVEFRGVRYYLDNDGYYKASRSNGRGLLHRAIWAAEHGPIPDGWHVHHRDHDRGNNDPANLVALPAGDHHRRHMDEDGLRGFAVESPEVRSRWARESWARRQPRDYVCRECDQPYQSKSNKPTHYCSRKCCDRAMGRKRTERDRQRREAGL